MYGYKFSILFKHPIMGFKLMNEERKNMKQRKAFGVGALDIENLDSYLNHVIATGVMSLLDDGTPPKSYKLGRDVWRSQMGIIKDGFLAAEELRHDEDLDEETRRELQWKYNAGLDEFVVMHRHLHM